MEEPVFSSKLTFHMNVTLHRHWRMWQVSAVTIFLLGKISIKHGLNSHKRPSKLDILGGRFLEVRLY